jgi:hypothetical protein
VAGGGGGAGWEPQNQKISFWEKTDLLPGDLDKVSISVFQNFFSENEIF